MEGADELFYGYDHYIKFNNFSFAFREYLTAREEYLYDNNKSRLNTPFDDLRKNSIKNLRKKAIQSEYQSRDLEIKTHLLSLLKRNDRMGMAHSIEIRCPYLDHNLFNYMYGQDQSDLASNQKYYLEEILNAVNPKLSKTRKKNGFIAPFDENFTEIIKNHESKKWIGIACDYVSENFRLSLKDKEKLTPRLGWTLMNIGCFLESF